MTNTAAVTSTTPDATSGNNSAAATVQVSGSADLALTKTSNPRTITPGNPVSYTLTLSNNGPSTATGASIADTLPAGLTFSSGTAGCTAEGQLVTCRSARSARRRRRQ